MNFGFTLRATDMDLPSPTPTRRTTTKATKATPSARLLQLVVQATLALTLVSVLVVLWPLIAGSPLPGKSGLPEALLILSATTTTLASQSRILPGPNVLTAALIIGLIGGLAHGLGARTAFPFGPFVYSETIGPQFFNALAWPLPLIWIIVILNSRGVAKLILRPWRKVRNYGFWLIGVSAALVMLFDLALEPFAARANHFWIWERTKLPFTWYGAPLVNFLGWLLVALLILAFTTPALTKKPARSKNKRIDYHPLILWLLPLTLFATSAFQNQLWAAATLGVVTATLTTILAVRGARW